ncbi:MAG: DNA mismatch repair protein MutL, partial [Deltaproteobacteria bacterium CG_4_10_14_0_2_um_filter_43_8]
MGNIRVLERSVIERIAAGEVIERPASVLKELIENALDAAADVITVEVSEGGKKCIRVTDNGCGMDAEDAKLSIIRHATSKIKSDNDLWSIASFGFRGEALAAASAVSKFSIETKLASGKSDGIKIVAMGGEIVEQGHFGCPAGTSVVVEDLFYNVPARLKFLKSDHIEFNHIVEVFQQAALSHPSKRFELLRDGKQYMVFPVRPDPKGRIADVFGQKIKEEALFTVEEHADDYSLQGFVAHEDYSKAQAKYASLFVNGRAIKDKSLLHAFSSAYGERLAHGRYPLGVLFLELDPSLVDVNVHPQKREVRFSEPSLVYDFIKSSVRKALSFKPQEEFQFSAAHVSPLNTRDETERSYEKKTVAHVEKRNVFSSPIFSQKEKVYPLAEANSFEPLQQQMHHDASLELPLPGGNVLSDVDVLGQFDRTYVICEASGSRLVLIDQHAAHERIGFDLFKQQYEASRIEQQQLLLPETLELGLEEASTLLEHLHLFPRLGFEIEPFGERSFVI